MIAAIYARKSTDQHGADADAKSVPRQIDNARAFAKSKGWSVTNYVYADEAISGAETKKLVNRQRLLDALGTGRRPPFQVLIMRDPSRFSRRDGDEAFGELKAIVKAGVEIWFYGDGQKFTFGTFSENVVGFVRAEMNAEFRRQIATWTREAMLRKAKAGHVTGGRTFGYDNVKVDGHVERRINASEAAVVKRIFTLCIKGYGQIAIAKQLNAEAAPAPQSQQGRPRAWAPSSVREVLLRDLYRGVCVWNKTRKRNAWGQVAATARPESEWERVPMPKLRIVSDAMWNAAHERLGQTREAYLRVTGGRLYGRPLDGAARKYLLTGLSRCGLCGGTLEVRSRSHGKKRVHFYACSSYYRRGKSVCPNKLEVRLDATEAAVLDALERELLTPAFVEKVVRKVLTRRVPTGTEADELRATLTRRLTAAKHELEHLVDALARTGMSPAVAAAIKQREAQRAEMERELADLDQQTQLGSTDVVRIEDLARERVLSWRKLLRRHVPQARQILQKMLRGRLTFTPESRGKQRGYRFTGEGSLMPLLSGTIPELAESSQAMASPTGFEPVFWP